MTREDAAAEAALAPFIAAARAEASQPRLALLNAILADAAEVSAARAVPAPAPARRRGWAWRLAPVGGWPGLAALGACAAIGFWAGTAGFGTPSLWTSSAVAAEAGADPVADFFDLAAAEG